MAAASSCLGDAAPILKHATCVLALLPVLVGAAASAETPTELLQKGIAALGGGQIEASVQLLEQARAATSDRKLLGQIHLYLGLNHVAAGATAKARAALATALGHDSSLRLDPQRFKPEFVLLFEEVRRGLSGELTVGTEGPPARVLVDGEERGRAPFTGQLSVGDHTVEVVSADGLSTYRARVKIGPGAPVRLVARLERKTSPLSVATSPPGAEVLLDGGGLGVTPLRTSVEAGDHLLTLRRAGYREETLRVTVGLRGQHVWRALEPRAERRGLLAGRRWTWIAAAAGLAALGVGVGVGVAADHDYDGWVSHCLAGYGPGCVEARDTVRRKDAAANAMFGVAGALAVTSVVLYFIEGRARAKEHDRRLRPIVGAAGAGLRVGF